MAEQFKYFFETGDLFFCLRNMLFNRRLQAVKMSATWKELGLSGRQRVRDLWLQKDLGDVNGEFSASVPAHGAVLVKIGTRKP